MRNFIMDSFQCWSGQSKKMTTVCEKEQMTHFLSHFFCFDLLLIIYVLPVHVCLSSAAVVSVGR